MPHARDWSEEDRFPHPTLPFHPHSAHPATLQEAGAKFEAARKDLAGIIDTCAERTHALIFRRGAGSCPGPKAGSWNAHGEGASKGAASKRGAAPGALLGRKGMGDGSAVE